MTVQTNNSLASLEHEMGKLKLNGQVDVTLSGSTKTEVRIDPTPISLRIETATDWAAVLATALVGVAGIFTALVVASFTRKAADQAARATESSSQQAAAATAAGIRNAWMQSLRNEAAEFYASILDLAFVIHVEGSLSPENKDEVKLFKMQKHRAVISMMLDAKKPLVVQLKAAMDEAADAVSDKDYKRIISASKVFKNQATLLLEDAWQDIKSDLYGPIK